MKPTATETVNPILDKYEEILTQLLGAAHAGDGHAEWGRWCGADWAFRWAKRDELITLQQWADLRTEFTRESVCDVIDVSSYWPIWDSPESATGFVEGALLMWEYARLDIYRLASQAEQQQAKIADRGPLPLAERIRLHIAWTEAKSAAQIAIAAAKRAHDAWMEGGRSL